MGITKSNNSRNATPFKGSGEKGQSLFHTFIINIAEKELKYINDNYSRLLSFLGQTKEDRLVAIVGYLFIEEAVDNLLRAYIPKYNLLEDNKISFWVKLSLAHSLTLIPKHLLNAVEGIRIIRNEFAHELHKNTFDSLPDGKKT